MKRFLFAALFLLALRFPWPIARATSLLPMTVDERIRASDAVFHGTVLEVQSCQDPVDGLIYTRTSLRVDESFKGRVPPVIQLVHRGGTLDGIGEMNDLSPQFRVGEERLLFVARRPDSTLFAVQGGAGAIRLLRDAKGAFVPAHRTLLEDVRVRTDFGKLPGADVTDQASGIPANTPVQAPSGDVGGASTNGLLVDASGVPSRFVAPDRGDTIPYLVDASALPAGITVPQALTAVSNAFGAWAAVSSFRFVFAGTQAFGMAAGNINTNDGIFRIQLHDNYNFINSPNVLGEGGSYFFNGLLANAGWGKGGNVTGTEFNLGSCGYVVLEQTNTALQTLSTLTEVLCHEIGHVIGLAHSSEDPNETNTVLKQAIMYYLVHADGRGASLNSYDTNTVVTVHPFNTPPFSYNRVMDITTAGNPPSVPGINAVEMRGYDLQSTNLTLFATNLTILNGTFTNVGGTIRYAAYGLSSGNRLDPAGPGYYDLLYSRHSDGTNASPYVNLRAISLNVDQAFYPASDGIPDNWMAYYFGHIQPQSGDKSRATDDFDGDGLNNLQEYIAGMNPTNAASGQRLTSINGQTLRFQAKPYELYEVLTSTDLTNWSRVGNPVWPTNAPIEIRTNLMATNIIVTFSNLPTGAGRQFFRVLKVP